MPPLKQTSPLALYSYFRSSASFRVRIALNLKGLAYDYLAVHLLRNGGEQRMAQYQRLNPSLKVPCLVEDGRALGESVAIIEYLDEKYPQPPLFPQDLWLRARTRQIVELINSGIQPLQNVSVAQKLTREIGASESQARQWTIDFIEAGLSSLEQILSETAGSYCIGGELTAADLFLVPQFVSSQRFGANTDKFPLLKSIALRCLELPAFVRAHPAHQPDSEN